MMTTSADRFARGAAAAMLAMLLAAPAFAAPSVSITSPRNGETVHDNRGRITVSVVLEDGADASLAALQPVVDGAPREVQRSSTFTLSGIDRGSHTLQVRLLSADGEVLATSRSIEFHMWQASRLFPNRR